MPKKVILDVDTGGDDAVAILLAGHHRDLDLVAVTVTYGNGPLVTTLDNTLRVISTGRLPGVPVFPGADRPLVGEMIATDPVQYATLPLPESDYSPQPQRAVDFLIDYYLGHHGPDTYYVLLGPQTNLALALRLAPAIVKRIPRIITMAGAYLEGNTTPSAEFNVLADPEAAHIVFNSGIPITMVGLEVTAQALVSLDDARRLGELNNPWARAAARVMEDEIHWFIDNLGWNGGQIFDACAVAVLIEPSILETKLVNVDIELNGTLTRGRTVADMVGYHKKTPNVDVGVTIDRQQFMQILFDGLT